MRATLCLLAILSASLAGPNATACDAIDGTLDAIVTDLHGNRLATIPNAAVTNACQGTWGGPLGGEDLVTGESFEGVPGRLVDWRTGHETPLPAPGGMPWHGAYYLVAGENVTRFDLASGGNETWRVPGLPARSHHGLAFGLTDRLRIYDLEARAWIVDQSAAGLPKLFLLEASPEWIYLGNATDVSAVRISDMRETYHARHSWAEFPITIAGDDLWLRLTTEPEWCCLMPPADLGWKRVHLPDGSNETGTARTLLDVQGSHMLFAETGNLKAWGAVIPESSEVPQDPAAVPPPPPPPPGPMPAQSSSEPGSKGAAAAPFGLATITLAVIARRRERIQT